MFVHFTSSGSKGMDRPIGPHTPKPRVMHPIPVSLCCPEPGSNPCIQDALSLKIIVCYSRPIFVFLFIIIPPPSPQSLPIPFL